MFALFFNGFAMGKLYAKILIYSKEMTLMQMEVPPRFELGMKVLQTFALPLGDGTKA